MRTLLLVLLLLGMVRAEDGIEQMALLDLRTGRVECRYELDRALQRQILDGSETPRYAGTRRFLAIEQPELGLRFETDPATKPVETGPIFMRPDEVQSLGRLSDGTEFAFRITAQDDSKNHLELGLLERGQLRVLAWTTFANAGRSLYVHDPIIAIAGPFLLLDEPTGVRCLRWRDGSQAWRSSWHFAHSRWGNQAFYQQGCLFADVAEGLARVDPATGKFVWVWRQPAEFIALRAYGDGLVYAAFFRDERALTRLLETAGGKPEFSRVIPHGKAFFGATLRQGVWTVWEWRDGQWSRVFKHRADRSDLDLLYAHYGFSPAMRRRLTSQELDGAS